MLSVNAVWLAASSLECNVHYTYCFAARLCFYLLCSS